MSCILRISGETFDVDDFVFKSGINSYKTFYKGESIFKSKSEGKRQEFSGCSIEISSAGFNEFNKQVADATEYLTVHNEKLKLIPIIPEIQFAVLDFGITYDVNKFVQSKYLPNKLLKLCVGLGICIEVTIYQQTLD